MRLAPGTILRDKYQIVRKVDEGGGAGGDAEEGAVFEARHLDLAGRYAVKFLCEGGIRNAVLLDSLRREALATSALSHPGIVRVYDLDQAPDGSPFIVMEFLNGQNLARVIRETGPLALSDVAVIIESIAAPLGEAHRRGIVHGELTPDNVFVLDADADPHARVKLLDFGVARIRAQAGGIVRSASSVGASGFLAPEQQQGRTWEVDERSDVFSLGAIAHALVTGGAPPSSAAARTTGPVVAGGAAPPVVSAAIARAMSAQREGRFRTAMDFARALRAAVSVSPARASGIRATRLGATPAVPVPTLTGATERVRHPPSMRRILAAAVGCGVAVLVGVVAISKLTHTPRPVARPAAPPVVAAAPPKPTPAPAPAPAAPALPAPVPVRTIDATDRAREPLPAVRRRPRSAHAGMTDEARREMEQTYQKASRAFDLRNYEEAVAAYKRTYELGGDAPMLYNIAQALRLDQRPEEAARFYRRYLERAPNAANRIEVVGKIEELTGSPAKAAGGVTAPSKASPDAAARSPFNCHWPERAAAGKAVDVSCSDVDPQTPVVKAVLHYRATGTSAFVPLELAKEAKGSYKGSIPPAGVSPKGLEVYFEGRRATGETATQNGSPTRPNQIAVSP